jgi:nicotinate-nucleotide pyrophosphorylase (carboxylating)
VELTMTDAERWLAEDIGDGDLTSLAVIDEEAVCEARVLLKETGVICGLQVGADVFASAGARLEPLVRDGEVLGPGPVARVEGPARAVLAAERTALNLLGRLSGIATLTRRYVDAVSGTGVDILDTRKTTPGLRALEKYAVRCGGGANHRHGLYDAVLIKDNHIRLAGGIRAAVERARSADATRPVEVEAESLEDVREVRHAGADVILLDNMDLTTLRQAVALTRGRAKLEASGGITLETVREIAETGVDFISVGALTHSAKALDVSLEVL